MMTVTLREFNAILTIAYRDFLRFLRDPSRLIGTLILPILFVGGLGGGLQATLGAHTGYNFLALVFTGVFAQTLFQSTAFGMISLIEDRDNDFTQEIFVSPISRYSIIFGKITGESVVALAQAIVVVLFGFVLGIPMTIATALALIPVGLIVCLLGGSFGLILLSLFGSQRAANQILPFLIFPQFFTAGVFNPIPTHPWILVLISLISPLRYGVDLTRGVYYLGQPAYSQLVIFSPLVNLLLIAGLFLICLVIGTTLFVRSERNK